MCFLRGLVHNDYICDNAVMKTKICVILFFRTSEFHQLCELPLIFLVLWQLEGVVTCAIAKHLKNALSEELSPGSFF